MIDESHRFAVGETVVVVDRAFSDTERHLECEVSRMSGDLVSVRCAGKLVASFRGARRRATGKHFGHEPELRTPEEDAATRHLERCAAILRELSDGVRNVPMVAASGLRQLLEQCLELTNNQSPKGE